MENFVHFRVAFVRSAEAVENDGTDDAISVYLGSIQATAENNQVIPFQVLTNAVRDLVKDFIQKDENFDESEAGDYLENLECAIRQPPSQKKRILRSDEDVMACVKSAILSGVLSGEAIKLDVQVAKASDGWELVDNASQISSDETEEDTKLESGSQDRDMKDTPKDTVKEEDSLSEQAVAQSLSSEVNEPGQQSSIEENEIESETEVGDSTVAVQDDETEVEVHGVQEENLEKDTPKETIQGQSQSSPEPSREVEDDTTTEITEEHKEIESMKLEDVPRSFNVDSEKTKEKEKNNTEGASQYADTDSDANLFLQSKTDMPTLGCFNSNTNSSDGGCLAAEPNFWSKFDKISKDLSAESFSFSGNTCEEWRSRAGTEGSGPSSANPVQGVSSSYNQSENPKDVFIAGIKMLEDSCNNGNQNLDQLLQLIRALTEAVTSVWSSDDEELKNIRIKEFLFGLDETLFAKVKKLASNARVVEQVQRVIASEAFRNLVIDLGLNDVNTMEEVRKILLSHIGEVFTAIGELFRETPQVLTLLPYLLNWLNRLIVDKKQRESSKDESSNDNLDAKNKNNCNCNQNNNNNFYSGFSRDGIKCVHRGILCDGCDTLERKAAATENGTIKGVYIYGVRYKSAVRENFDLCESCESTGDFDAEYAPFLKIKSPDKAPREIVCVLPAYPKPSGNRQDHNSFGPSVTSVTVSDEEEEVDVEVNGAKSKAPLKFVLKCPGEHPLVKFQIPNRLFGCDVCDDRPAKGSLMWGCRLCDWDICGVCAQQFSKTLVQEPQMPPPSSVANANVSGDTNSNSAAVQGEQNAQVPSLESELHSEPQRSVSSLNSVSAVPNPPAAKPKVRPRASFLEDVTVQDGSVVMPGESIMKIWRVENPSRELPWPTECRIVCVGGDLMGANPQGYLVPPLPAKSNGDLCVQLTAPRKPGRYISYWRLVTKDNTRFGQRFWIDISVVTPDEPSLSEQAQGLSAGPLEKWKESLERLADMQFTDIEKNVKLLEANQGDLSDVVAYLLKESEKKE